MASEVRNEKSLTSKMKRRKEKKDLGSSQESSKVCETSGQGTPEKSDDEDAKGTSRSSDNGSPEQNCPICLGKLQNKSFTDSCFHMFCFICLKEWTKVKAECPLCKQKYSSVLYDVKSYEEYKQISVSDIQEQGQRRDDHHGHRFRYRTTLTVERRLMMDLFPENLRSHIEHDYTLHRPTHRATAQVTARTHWRRQRQAATSEFRRRAYINGLRVREVSDQRFRQRDISPEFFSRNPATTHRLVPWLNRELNALLQNHSEQAQWVLDFILELIKSYPINSEQFYQHLYPHIGRHTRHFMHEFEHFAKSPYNMASYDQHAVYEPQTFEILSADESDSGENDNVNHDNNNDDDDVIILSPSPPNSQSTEVGETNFPENRIASPTQAENASPLVLVQEESFDGQREPPAERRGASFQNISPILERVRLFLRDTQNAPNLSTAGWDSPTPGPSWVNMDNSNAQSAQNTADIPLPDTPPLLTNIRQEPNTEDPQQKTKLKLPVFPPMLSELFNSARTIKIEDDSESSIDSDSDSGESSDSSAVVFVKMDKAWDARSPIMLSSESDDEILKEASRKNKEKRKEKYAESKKRKHKSSNTHRDRDLERQEKHHSRHSRDHSHKDVKRHLVRSRSRSRERLHSHHRKQKKHDRKERSRSRDRIYFRESYSPEYYQMSGTSYRHSRELEKYRRRQRSRSDSSERRGKSMSRARQRRSTSSNRSFGRYRHNKYGPIVSTSYDRQERSRSKSIEFIRHKRSRSSGKGQGRQERYRSSSEESYSYRHSKSKKKASKVKKHKKHHKKHKKAAYVISSDSDFDIIAVGPQRTHQASSTHSGVTGMSAVDNPSVPRERVSVVETPASPEVEDNCQPVTDSEGYKQYKKHPTGHKKGSKQSAGNVNVIETATSNASPNHDTQNNGNSHVGLHVLSDIGHYSDVSSQNSSSLSPNLEQICQKLDKAQNNGESSPGLQQFCQMETTENNDCLSSNLDHICELETNEDVDITSNIPDLVLGDHFSGGRLIDRLNDGDLCLSPISDTSTDD